MTYAWDNANNELLRETRGVSFEEMVVEIEAGNVVDVLEHPRPGRYADQQVYLVSHLDYVLIVPLVRDEERLLIESLENDEWVSVRDLPAAVAEAQTYASATLK